MTTVSHPSMLLLGCLLAASSGQATAQTISIDALAPSLDRWMYPFGDFTGTRTAAPTYTTLYSGYTIFDDRDAQYLAAFNTATQVTAGFLPMQYRVQSATVRVTCSVADAGASFIYDPTLDPVSSYFDAGDPTADPPRAADPLRTEDPDAGRPVELFAVGFRGGFTPTSFAENSPFGPASPQPRTRYAYPVDWDGSGIERDVSNNVTDRFDTSPLSVAAAFTSSGDPMTAGQTVLDGAELKLAVDTSRTVNADYIARSLAQGRLNVLVSSLHPATAFGAGPVSYPVFRTRESLLGPSTALSLVVTLCIPDIGAAGGVFAADGNLDNNDFVVFIDRFFAQDPVTADIGVTGGLFGRDGRFDNNDFIVFIDRFFEGC
ncbi:MAG TPA: GC-type dockerin domain-anchored protein [Phycisphaerales bacterium]|nr:GC-type dockerin domain-anchored protein [Phycisphaerales bacterium]